MSLYLEEYHGEIEATEGQAEKFDHKYTSLEEKVNATRQPNQVEDDQSFTKPYTSSALRAKTFT